MGKRKEKPRGAFFPAGKKIRIRRAGTEPRAFAPRQSIDALNNCVIRSPQDLEHALFTVSNEDSVRCRQIKNAVRRAEACDALQPAAGLQVKDFDGLVILSGKKQTTAFFFHGKVIKIAGDSRKLLGVRER